jgi:ligand-binding sensor domain-containing protein
MLRFKHSNLFVVKVFLAWILIQFTGLAHAQEYTFIQYGLKEGIIQSQVRCLHQDSRGYIWAGTLGGLSRFDGKEFKSYDRQNGFLNNQVNCIIELSSGAIMVGSNGSVVLINGAEVKSILLESEFAESSVNALFQDNDGRVIIGTENGICEFREGKITYPASSTISKENVQAFCKRKKDGALFILTKTQIYLRNGNEIIPFWKPLNNETNLFGMTESPDHYLWLASKGEGLIKLNENGTEAISINDFSGSAIKTINDVLCDRNGELWISSRLGFFHYKAGNFKFFSQQNGLKSDDIRDILEDYEGNIWLATNGSGLLKFTGEAFASYTTSQGLSSNAVMSVVEDQYGQLWLSTFDGGICKFSGDSIIQMTIEGLSSTNRIWTSLRDAQNHLWFGSSSGLFEFDGNKFYRHPESGSLDEVVVLSLYQSSDNKLWVGTSKGAYIFENGILSSMAAQGGPQKRIRCIREDALGNIWMATTEGVVKFDGSTFTTFTMKDGLPDNSTYALEMDEFNRAWVGTQNGLAVLSGSAFRKVDMGVNSGAQVVNFLKYTPKQMWVGTNNGLHAIKVNIEFNESLPELKHYVLEDGLRSLETNLNSAFLDHSGILWFGTADGLMRFDATKTSFNSLIEPRLLLSNIQINLQNRDWQELGPIDSLSGLPICPKFKYKDNHITFYFTGISTTYPDELKYQYMLEGLDEDWKPLTEAGFATYSNLPYRSFIFKVRALNRQGFWSKAVEYPFSIAPPFWLTWWFILVEILAGLGIISAIVLSRMRAAKAKSEKEWFEVRSRMLALEQQSLNSSMNRHFIFNALNSIQYYINRQDKLAANKYLSDFARLIRKNLDSSQENTTSLRDEVERLELYLKLEHMRFKDKFDYKIHIDPALNLDTIKVPAMLVQPFLENSIWHGLLPKNAHGTLDVNITLKDGHLEFIISDSGIGISNSLSRKTGTDTHISKGMQITQSRIELIKKTTGMNIELQGPYQLHADETHPEGTRVKIILPINFHELFSN